HAAARLRDQPNLHFLIIGDGKEKEGLLQLAQEMQLTNVQFKPLQPMDKLAASLSSADIHLVLQKKAAADLVMPSKLTNVLAVGGHALITADPGTTLYELVSEHQLGTLVEPENVDALAAGLRAILSGACREDNAGALAFADRQLNKENILNGFQHSIQKLIRLHSELSTEQL
ncbi:MAG: glycosyltransferase, partial [Bacteroidota bacterium]